MEIETILLISKIKKYNFKEKVLKKYNKKQFKNKYYCILRELKNEYYH